MLLKFNHDIFRNKISNFCHVEPSQVINIKDLATIYHVPVEMVRQNIVNLLRDRLQLPFQPVRQKYGLYPYHIVQHL